MDESIKFDMSNNLNKNKIPYHVINYHIYFYTQINFPLFEALFYSALI